MKKIRLSNIVSIYKSQYCKLNDFIRCYKEKNISENEIVDSAYASKRFKLRMKDSDESVSIEKYDANVIVEQVNIPILRTIEQSYYSKHLKKNISYRYEIVIPQETNEKMFYDNIRCYTASYPTHRFGSYLIVD